MYTKINISTIATYVVVIVLVSIVTVYAALIPAQIRKAQQAASNTQQSELLRLERSNQQFQACQYNKTFVTIFEAWQREINVVDRGAVIKHTIPKFYYMGHRKAGVNLEYRLHHLVPVDCKVPNQQIKSL